MPVTDEWRARMRAAREAKGYTQLDIATRCGVKQSSISVLEAGKTAASPLVAKISRILHIDLPLLVVDDDEFSARWRKLEALLREQSPDLAEQVLKLAETLAETLAKK